MLLFLAGILVVVLIGIFPGLRPAYQVVTDGGGGHRSGEHGQWQS